MYRDMVEVVLGLIDKAIEEEELDFLIYRGTPNGLSIFIKDNIAHVDVYFPRGPYDDQNVRVNWVACGPKDAVFTEKFVTMLELAADAAKAAESFIAAPE